LLALCIDLLTELLPATSFAFEKPESLIMLVPPRNVKTDKLTSFKLLFYAYAIGGIILTGGCLFTFFRMFQWYGVSPADIYSNFNRCFPARADDTLFVTNDGSGRIYDKNQQQDILYRVQGAWYLMIVCGQASHVWVCRTTTVSIFEHGIFNNKVTNYGVVVALLLGCFVTYTPGLQGIVQSANPHSLDILYASLMVAGCHWFGSEGRKWYTRNYPQHWLNKHVLDW